MGGVGLDSRRGLPMIECTSDTNEGDDASFPSNAGLPGYQSPAGTAFFMGAAQCRY